ncbi:unnamed protein product [Rotaria magnacalcarata]|uniref:Uncharacterized protein n=1 Tax=Rotaria magnacalcarata TaxID=392030 RepID=A0A816SEP3_9BILA|nr:unnamed protein product [Rotaria magnacalcarata]CAF2263750.1 unnamed protein product [Rotaria magnacalcarata]
MKDQRTSSNHRTVRYPRLGVVVAICLITCALVSIAVLVVISLIPLYLPDSTMDIASDSTESDVVGAEYATSYQLSSASDLSYIPIKNLQELGSQIATALNVDQNTISVVTAQMNATSTTKSSVRRRRQTSCAAETASGGARAEIRLSIRYPRRCGRSSACKATFLETIKNLLATMAVFSPILDLDDGIGRVPVSLKICHVTVEKRERTATTIKTITTSVSTTSTTTACSDTYGYFEQVTGHTCQTYIDYGFCNGLSVVTTSGIDSVSAQENCCSCGKRNG